MSNLIELYRGDTADYALTVTDVDGSAVNIQGFEFIMTVKKNPSQADTDAIIQASGTIEDAGSGVVTFAISEASSSGLSPGTYVYDIQAYKSETGIVQTVTWDKFIVKNDVTKNKTVS